jgi:hypothetical protein
MPTEIETKLRRNYDCRNRTLFAAVADGAKRTDAVQSKRGKCTFCNRRENGGGLRVYTLRDGSEVFAGGRCSEYLDFLLANPGAIRRVR